MDPSLKNSFLVLVCAYNEEERIGGTISEIRAECGDAEIMVVDDGSEDATARVAASSGVTVLALPFNLGYGAALQTGYRYALRKGYRYVVQMDADGQHIARYIGPLMEAVVTGGADVAIGSRFLGESGYVMPLRKKVFVRIFRGIISLVTGKAITDPTSGFQALGERAVRLYSSDVYPVDFPDADVLIMLHRMGLSFVEVPVEMRPSPRKKTMHGGLLSLYYVFKMFLSILVVLLRRYPGEEDAGGEVEEMR
jgi:glycosyltransferase involved in cell wall biosynthesis